jgi:hypothetical protein
VESDSDGDLGKELELPVEYLSRLRAADIVGFAMRRRDLASRAYRADLWGAAFIINGGCSDDGFEYFRARNRHERRT